MWSNRLRYSATSVFLFLVPREAGDHLAAIFQGPTCCSKCAAAARGYYIKAISSTPISLNTAHQNTHERTVDKLTFAVERRKLTPENIEKLKKAKMENSASQ